MTGQTGSVTLWIIGVLVLFAVILTASLQFIVRQSHATIVQEQEEQAFAAAEGGIHHALWLLNSGAATPASLPATVIAREPLTNSAGDVVARFTVSFSAAGSDAITATSVGSDEEQPTICQVIRAEIGTVASGGYAITAWEHLLDPACQAGSNSSGRMAATPTSIVLGSHHEYQLTASEPVHYYTFTAAAGDQIRLTVQSASFTPRLTVTDSAGVVVAQVGQEFQLAHIRYAARLRQVQDSLTTFVGGGSIPSEGCSSSLYTACIPRDLGADPMLAWWPVPSAGTYDVELGSVAGTLGDYRFETAKR